jgi:hypothetical protein
MKMIAAQTNKTADEFEYVAMSMSVPEPHHIFSPEPEPLKKLCYSTTLQKKL